MGRQTRPNRTNVIKSIDKPKSDDLYTIRLLYKCIDYRTPRTRLGTWPMHLAFISYNMPCPRLSISKEYTFYFTSASLTIWLPVIKKTLLERNDLSYCTMLIYSPNKVNKIAYRDKTQVVTNGEFRRKQHELITAIKLINNAKGEINS